MDISHHATVAMAKASDAKRMMDYPADWEIVVWENIGWCYRLVCGPIHVTPSRYGRSGTLTFHATLHCDDSNGELADWAFPPGEGYFRHPMDAVEARLKHARWWLENRLVDRRAVVKDAEERMRRT